jgi:methyl-accepting chemotaxis protein
MQWFLNLKIGTKLLAGFIFVAMIAGVIGYVGVSSLKSTAEAGTELFEKQTVPIVRMGKI